MKENEAWFALATSYCRELIIKKHFDDIKFKNFVPMKSEYIEVNGKPKLKWVPAIHNLVFVHSTRKQLQDIKKNLEGSTCTFRWMIDYANGQPIIVPNRQMEYFMKICESGEEGLQFFDDNEQQTFKKGDYVQVTAGPFAGVEGYLVRIKKSRCVFVAVKGVAAVATTYINPSLLHKIEEPESK